MAMVIEALSGPRPSARDEGPERAVAFAGLSTRAGASYLPIALRSAITNDAEIAVGARTNMVSRGDFGGEPAFAPRQGFYLAAGLSQARARGARAFDAGEIHNLLKYCENILADNAPAAMARGPEIG
jgi:hypothetical protein